MKTNLNILTAANVKFSESMHVDVCFISKVSNMDKSKVIRAAMMCGLEQMKVVIADHGDAELTALIADKDKQTRTPIYERANASDKG